MRHRARRVADGRSDQLCCSEMPLVWTYMYTTAQSEDLDPDFQASDFKAPMAGFGYGLPLARLVSEERADAAQAQLTSTACLYSTLATLAATSSSSRWRALAATPTCT